MIPSRAGTAADVYARKTQLDRLKPALSGTAQRSFPKLADYGASGAVKIVLEF